MWCDVDVLFLFSVLMLLCVQHIANCSGQGLLFLVEDCAVLYVRKKVGANMQGCVMPPIYLDKYGEPDIGV